MISGREYAKIAENINYSKKMINMFKARATAK